MKTVGIVGTGVMGETHAASWLETDARLSHCSSGQFENAKRFAEKYSIEACEDLDALIAAVDVVDICTPTHLHKEMVLKAAAAGKDIVCEKPLGLTVEDCVMMIRACEEAGVKLYVAHVTRYFPEYVAAKANVVAGEVGKVAVTRFRRESFQPHNASDNWYVDLERSGGMLQDLMIHDFDLARWMAGDVIKVYAKSLVTSGEEVNFDHAMVILTHKDGVISHITGSWAQPKPRFRTSFEIAGDAGIIEWDSQEKAPLQVLMHQTKGGSGEVGLPGSPLLESPYTSQLKEFLANLESDAPVRVDAVDALAAVQIARAAIESALTGKAVDVMAVEEVLR